MKEYNKENLANLSGKYAFAFKAPWCGPCKQMTPVLDKLCDEGFNILEVDVDKCQDVAMQYNIRSVPTMIFFENNEIIKTHSGLMNSDEIKSYL
jgi:thioredoxin 1